MRASRAAPALLLGAALALAGCGGGASKDSSASVSSGTTREASAPEKAAKGKQGNDDASAQQGKPKPKPPSHHLVATVKVPPISSAPVAGSTKPAPGVKTVPGGDNSVQTYGVESGSSERTEAAIALQAYLNARLEEDWGEVCSHLAQKARAQLEEAIEGSEGKQGAPSGCAATMALLAKGTPASQAREQTTITEVLSLRGGGGISGDPFYLIFAGPPAGTLYSMPMYLEGGEWKVGLAVASELPV